MTDLVKCDRCGTPFSIQTAGIRSTWSGDYMVQYFTCPGCHHRYQILTTNTIRQVLITLQKYRLSVVDFSVHRFFAILENGDEVLRSFCAVDVRRKRRFQLRAGLAHFNGLFATENLLAPVRLDTDKNSLAHFTTSGGSSSGAQNFTAP